MACGLVGRLLSECGLVADGFPLAAGLGAAQVDDGVGAVDGSAHAGPLEALADDGLAIPALCAQPFSLGGDVADARCLRPW